MRLAERRRHRRRIAAHFAERRLVRLIVFAGSPADDDEASTGDLTVEGFEVGVWAGWHILERARLLNADGTTTALDGGVEIPAGRVVFRQVIALATQEVSP